MKTRTLIFAITVCAAILVGGCRRHVAPPLTYNADNVQQLRDEIRDYDW